MSTELFKIPDFLIFISFTKHLILVAYCINLFLYLNLIHMMFVVIEFLLKVMNHGHMSAVSVKLHVHTFMRMRNMHISVFHHVMFDRSGSTFVNLIPRIQTGLMLLMQFSLSLIHQGALEYFIFNRCHKQCSSPQSSHVLSCGC